MKVEVLTNLKFGSGKYFIKGEVFSDPIPPVLLGELKAKKRTVIVLDDSPQLEPKPIVQKPVEIPVVEKPVSPKVEAPVESKPKMIKKIVRRSK